jgi:hypothetical protein
LVSAHSSAQWLSVLATNAAHATNGRAAAAQARRLAQAFRGQATWVVAQQALVAQRRARCEHLLHLLNAETLADAARERSLLDAQAGRQELRQRHVAAAKGRAEAADRVMRVLQEYGVLSGDEMADYYLYTINAIKDMADHPHHHGGGAHGRHAGAAPAGNGRRAHSVAASSALGASSYAASRPSSASSASTVATTAASGATTAANVKQRAKAAAKQKTTADAALKARVEQARGGGPGAAAKAELRAVGTYVPSSESYRPSAAHADASVFEKAGLAQTVSLLFRLRPNG